MAEGLGPFAADDFRLAVVCGLDVEAREEDLVPGALREPVHLVVGIAGLLEQLAREPQRLLGEGAGLLGGFELAAHVGKLRGELGLLLGHEVQRHGAGDVRVEQTAAFAFEPLKQPPLAGKLAIAVPRHEIEGLAEAFFELGDARGVEPDRLGVVASHGGFDADLAQVALLAGSPLVAGATDEVAVGLAPATVHLGEAQTGAAVLAVDGALEMVAVPPVLLARAGMVAHHLLDLQEGALVDEGGVAAGVFDAAVSDDPDVVWVGEQVVDRGAPHLARGTPARSDGAQPARIQRLDQRVDRVLAGRVGGERPLDERRSLGVEHDIADVVFAVPFAHVQVAERSAVGGAALLGLLGQPLFDLFAVLAGAVGVDRRQDAEREHALRRVVDRLGDRDKLTASGVQLGERGELGQLVAGEAIKTVDDEVVDAAVLAHEVQRLAQRGVDAFAGRLRRGDELVDDLGLELAGLGVAAVTLDLKGIPLVRAGPLGLALGRYA